MKETLEVERRRLDGEETAIEESFRILNLTTQQGLERKISELEANAQKQGPLTLPNPERANSQQMSVTGMHSWQLAQR